MAAPKFARYSRFIGSKENHDLFAWCVFVDANREQLNAIREVEYTLHPSFPEPVKTINDPTHCFALQSSGWGDFALRVRTTFKDGTVAKSTFTLKLAHDAWPCGVPIAPEADQTARQIYDALMEKKSDWRRISTLARKAQLSVEQTGERLDELARARIVRKSLDNQELWGATSRVGLLPEPR